MGIRNELTEVLTSQANIIAAPAINIVLRPTLSTAQIPGMVATTLT
jgi:hypothetical protein